MRQIAKEAKVCPLGSHCNYRILDNCRFGVSKLHITVFHTPLWAITGCIGTWIFSIIVVVYLMKRVFKDFDLEEENEDE